MDKLLELVPGAFVVLFTVVVFLKHQKGQQAEWIKCHKECGKSIQANTKMLGRIAGLIEHRIKQDGGDDGD